MTVTAPVVAAIPVATADVSMRAPVIHAETPARLARFERFEANTTQPPGVIDFMQGRDSWDNACAREARRAYLLRGDI